MVGLPPTGLRLDLDPGEFLRREKFLTGTMYGSEDPAVALPILLEHVAAGRLELAPLLGEVFSLDAIDDAVQASLELPPVACSSSPERPAGVKALGEGRGRGFRSHGSRAPRPYAAPRPYGRLDESATTASSWSQLR